MEADLQARLQDLDEILGGEQGTCNRYPLSIILEISYTPGTALSLTSGYKILIFKDAQMYRRFTILTHNQSITQGNRNCFTLKQMLMLGRFNLSILYNIFTPAKIVYHC